MKYVVTPADTFFPEMRVYMIALANMNAQLAHAETQRTIRTIVQRVNTGLPLIGTVSDSPLSDPFWIADVNCNEMATIYGIPEWGEYMRSHQAPEPQSISFEIGPGNSFPPIESGQVERQGRGQPAEDKLTSLTCYLIGGAFERVYDQIKHQNGIDPRSWPPALQFFRHLRNGCFHSNSFNILPYRGQDQIDPAAPPRWHTYVMPCDAAMNGQQVMNGFFRLPHVLPFLTEVGPLV